MGARGERRANQVHFAEYLVNWTWLEERSRWQSHSIAIGFNKVPSQSMSTWLVRRSRW
ncbi:MAG TPA: hypothetical protein VK211_26710 [Kamptonema sp.]|nr:hypothetical protein [Kamptonema sp.]